MGKDKKSEKKRAKTKRPARVYVDAEGRLCFRAGARHFLVTLTPRA